mmetsp:Transcript_65941/g.125682  ORF Transcript_65941/g.125682 Transcript_65941/m.125682 type:complete len:361 (-) Transcript_65941:103-1185(-)
MHNLVLALLAHVACMGRGRRVQIPRESQRSDPLAERQNFLKSKGRAFSKGRLNPSKALRGLLLSTDAAAAFNPSTLGRMPSSRPGLEVLRWWRGQRQARACMLSMREGSDKQLESDGRQGSRRTKDKPPNATKGGLPDWLPGWLHEFIDSNLGWMAIPAIVILLSVRLFVCEPFYIPSNSMYPTLIVNDQVAVETFSKNFANPRRGDIVVFTPPGKFYELEEGADKAKNPQLIKRVVAVQGDTVEVRNGALLVNGKKMYEPYVSETMRYTLQKMTVPAGCVFVLGDNRNLSDDSHKWGALPSSNVNGKAFYILWPIPRQGFIDAVMQDLEITGDPGPFLDIARKATTEFGVRALPERLVQ